MIRCCCCSDLLGSSFEPDVICSCACIPTGLWRIGRSLLTEEIFLVFSCSTTKEFALDGLGTCLLVLNRAKMDSLEIPSTDSI